ncbi:hypothetical protein IC620_13735 [Hazenella sp. IB182357]|uniref:HPr kinase/phosphorylase C-terminal domain-containing protein n=1 Tax=Polycladospora coralii TaxID=2771432 RepID=A0A926RYD6_9BACL|nr:hypothetical protein [Polycladospora coralii]MBD1373411.1 hypothetical protein [Polycladospora coralii]
MKNYILYGMKIKTEINFDEHLNRCYIDSYDFELVHSNNNLKIEIQSKLIKIYEKFIMNEPIPFEVLFQIDEKVFYLSWLTHYHFIIDIRSNTINFYGELDGEFYCVFFSRIVSFLLYTRGYTQIHGSAIQYKGKTVCFIGDSGAGKSTLASLAFHHGGKVITDDIIAIGPDSCEVNFGTSSLRLYPDSSYIPANAVFFDEVDKLRVNFNHSSYNKKYFPNFLFFIEINNSKGLIYEELDNFGKMTSLIYNAYNKKLLQNVFSDVMESENIKVFSELSRRSSFVKVTRHENTSPEDVFSLVQLLLT